MYRRSVHRRAPSTVPYHRNALSRARKFRRKPSGAGELEPDALRARVVEFGEDVEGLPPRQPGGGPVAGVVLDVADPVEPLRLAEPVPEFPYQLQRVPVAGRRLGVMA